jgi:hypothetical protein
MRYRPLLEVLEDRTLPSITPAIGDVFYIEMENHNLTQPSTVTSPQQLLGNPAAPYLNSLMTPGHPNAAQTSYASNYYNVLYNNPAVSIHPSEPNYVWQEGGSNFGVVGNDDDPYANNGNPNPNLNNNVKLIAATGNNPANLSGLLQSAGISWKSYQEDIDLTPPTGGSVNQQSTWPNPNLSSTVAPHSEWTVPTSSFSGTSSAYVNPYNGSNQYNFAVKHDGQLFYTDTNGGTLNAPNFSPSNPEAQYYAPLQQLQTDLANNTVARYNLITPDQYNDMHSSLNTDFTYNGVTYTHNTDQESIALGDNFLSQIVPQIMASQAYKNNGTIVIWYDETERGNTTQFTVPEVVISPLAKGNAYDSTLAYTHSSDLKSMQELFGVSAPGGGFLGDANTPGTNDIWDFFKFSPTITSTASPAVAVLSPTGATLSDSAALANGSNETGNLVFTLTGPNGFTYTQTDSLSGNGTYAAGTTLSQGAAPGTYTWSVSYAGDPNNFGATDQGGAAEQTTVVGPGATLVGSTLYLVGGNTNDQLNVTPTGSSQTGSTGINVNGKLNGVSINNQSFSGVTTIDVYGFGGNDSFRFAPSLTITTNVSGGDGTDQVRLGGGNNTVTLGNGAGDFVSIVGGGNNAVTLGDGNYDFVSIIGGGNNAVTLGNGAGDFASIVGNGNDSVTLGNGNNDSVSLIGNGNDQIQVGNGLADFVLMAGNGSDTIQTGTGSGVVLGLGSGQKTVNFGSSNWFLI